MEENKSFWTTLPGILTGIAAVITAISSILIFFYGGPAVEFFEASPDTIVSGESVTMNWDTSDATDVTISPGVGSVDLSGSVTISPTETTTYILKATKGSKSDAATEVVIVEKGIGPETRKVDPKIEFFEVSLDNINSGEGATLSWSVSDATDVTINQGIGNVDLKGSKKVYPTETTTYTITATNEAGSDSETETVYVDEVEVPIIEYFNANPEEIVFGESTTLSWSVSDATHVTITPDIGIVSSSGWATVSPTETTTYTIIAENKDENVESSTYVVVNTNVLSTPEQISPADGTIFDHYPRQTTLEWTEVPGATSYTVEIEYYYPDAWYSWITTDVYSNSYVFEFVGAQPGRWRVWALDSTGRESEKSDWWVFSYTI